MVKGYKRQVIVLRDPPGRLFDTVYFITKSDLPPGIRENDVLREAEAIAAAAVNTPQKNDSGSSPEPEKSGKSRDYKRRAAKIPCDGVLAYFSGAATVGVAAGAIALAARLIF